MNIGYHLKPSHVDLSIFVRSLNLVFCFYSILLPLLLFPSISSPNHRAIPTGVILDLVVAISGTTHHYASRGYNGAGNEMGLVKQPKIS